ncbi:Peptidase propeptide and YPEB domain protein [compost metagenome]
MRVDQIPQLVKDGKIKPLEDLNKIALDLHPGATITKTELDNHFNGYEYEVELRDAKNVEWDVDIDASNGKVLENKQDT